MASILADTSLDPGGTVVRSQLQGLQVDPELGLLSVRSFTCSRCLHWGFLRGVRFPPTLGELVTIDLCEYVKASHKWLPSGPTEKPSLYHREIASAHS